MSQDDAEHPVAGDGNTVETGGPHQDDVNEDDAEHPVAGDGNTVETGPHQDDVNEDDAHIKAESIVTISPVAYETTPESGSTMAYERAIMVPPERTIASKKEVLVNKLNENGHNEIWLSAITKAYFSGDNSVIPFINEFDLSGINEQIIYFNTLSINGDIIKGFDYCQNKAFDSTHNSRYYII